jgi:amidase
MNGLTIEHAVTRSVRDSAALLDATAGPAPGDPYYAPPPERPYAQEVGRNPGRLRIAFTDKKTYREGALHPDCVEAVRDAARLCEELGHEVEEATPTLNGEQIIDAFTKMWQAGVANGIDSVAALIGRLPNEDEIEPLTRTLYEAGKQIDASAYLIAVSQMQLMSRQMAAFFEKYDLWLTPTLGEPPVPLGTFDYHEGEEEMAGFNRAADFVPFTPLQNATGQPAMSVPLYWNGDDLPIGTHFAARYGDEAMLFRLAAQLEEARPWAHRRPPVSA